MTGNVVSIHMAREEGGPVESVVRAELVAGAGLRGDRHFGAGGDCPERHLTLIEEENVARMNDLLGLSLPAADIRRNVVVRGIALNELVGRIFTVGEVRARGVELCEPCAHMAALVRRAHGLSSVSSSQIVAALAGRGGLRAEVLEDGTLRPGDAVIAGPEAE